MHPNVDKRSFIRAKQAQIHQERAQRRHQIETLKYERIINDALKKRIAELIECLKEHREEAKERNPGELAFQCVMELAAKLDPKDDEPPPRPAGVHDAEEPLPTYTKMMATLLDQVNKTLDEKKVTPDQRYEQLIVEVGEHLTKVTNLQEDLLKKLAELEREENRKITSDHIHTGFNSSFINKSKSSSSGPSSSSSKPSETKVELLNPNYKDPSTDPEYLNRPDDEEITASPLARQFCNIRATDYRESHSFLLEHPELLSERETDGMLMLAFDAQLENKSDFARNCVHQALLTQYCRALGRDGVALFFKRITTPGHNAQEVFLKDVQDTYMRIKNRAREIILQRAKDEAEGKTGQVEQIQLHAVEPGTTINIRVPDPNSDDPEEKRCREIFESFSPAMRKALESGKLEEVNKVLGEMKVDEAEELVGKLGEVCPAAPIYLCSRD